MVARVDRHAPQAAPSPHPPRTGEAVAGAEHSSSSFERLANESGCSPDIVRDLYQREFELLQHGARVHGFIPVLAMKHVRNVLRQQRTLQSIPEAVPGFAGFYCNSWIERQDSDACGYGPPMTKCGFSRHAMAAPL